MYAAYVEDKVSNSPQPYSPSGGGGAAPEPALESELDAKMAAVKWP